jgi:hypothetical protein
MKSKIAILAAWAVATCLGFSLGARAGYAADLSGIWWIKDRSELAPVDHKTLPLLPEAAAQYKKYQADIAAGKKVFPGNQPCVPEGMTRLMLARYPFQILQRPTQVTFVHERMHLVRLIYLTEQLPKDIDDLDPWYDGHSVGHWDGDTLVVETAGFKSNSWIDKTGIPHSDEMRTTERFALADGGKILRDEMTVEDPKTFSKPWSMTIDYVKSPNVQLMDDVCTYGPPERDALKK